MPKLSERLAALADVPEAERRQRPAPGGLAERLAALADAPMTEQGQARRLPASGLSERLASLADAPQAEPGQRAPVTGLSERLASLAGAPQAEPGQRPQLQGLSQRLAGLAGAPQAEPGQRPRLQGLSERLAPLTAPPGRAEPRQRPPRQNLSERLASLANMPQMEERRRPPAKDLSERLRIAQEAMAPESTETLPFGEWLPDLPNFANPGSLTATNVISAANSYRPFPSLAAESNALTGTALGSFSVTDANKDVFIYAGDASKLYELVGSTFTDESKGGGYATGLDDVWEFASDGSEVLATNFTDAVQSIAAGGGGAGAFADLITSTNKPKAKHIATVRQFVVLGNTSDTTSGHIPNRLWWSAFADATDFDPDSATQSDYEDFIEGGWVQKIVGGAEYGVIFQEKVIRRMEYVGPPAIFALPAVDRSRGTPIPNSVVALGRDVFFIAEDGFFRFNGSQSIPIGANKVDREFWNQFDIGNKRAVSAAIDPLNKLVAWAFPGTGGSSSNANRIFLYNWVTQRWSRIDIDTQILLRTQTQGYTLEGLDAISTNIDTGFTESFDAEIWRGGKLRFGAFDTDNKLGYFTGGNLVATVGTTETQPIPGRRSEVTAARPLIDGTDSADATVEYLGRARLQDTPASAGTATINSDGETTLRNEARYHRFNIKIPANKDWDHAQGVDIVFIPAGKR